MWKCTCQIGLNFASTGGNPYGYYGMYVNNAFATGVYVQPIDGANTNGVSNYPRIHIRYVDEKKPPKNKTETEENKKQSTKNNLLTRTSIQTTNTQVY